MSILSQDLKTKAISDDVMRPKRVMDHIKPVLIKTELSCHGLFGIDEPLQLGIELLAYPMFQLQFNM